MVRVAGVVVVGLLLAGCGATGGEASEEPTALEKAHKACLGKLGKVLADNEDAAPAEEYLRLGADGKSLTVQTAEPVGEISSVYALAGTACVLDETGAPSSVGTKIDSTTALMGRQSDSWDGLEVSWSYHPDNGLDAVFETTA